MEEVDVSFEELLQQEETILKMEEVDEEVGVRVRMRLSLCLAGLWRGACRKEGQGAASLEAEPLPP